MTNILSIVHRTYTTIAPDEALPPFCVVRFGVVAAAATLTVDG